MNKMRNVFSGCIPAVKKITCWTVVLSLLSFPAFAEEPLFDMQKVTDGVYAAIARPIPRGVNSNAAIIICEDGVLVVDSHAKPSAARALIAEIRKITDRPVRFLVNTHYHPDHVWGNQAYAAAFPREVSIISSEATRDNMITKSIPALKQQRERVQRDVEGLKQRLLAEGDPKVKTQLEMSLAQSVENLKELNSMDVVLPDVTLDKSLILHEKERDVLILFLGRGHTSGDVVVYLPKEKIVATGDMLHGWLPYLAGEPFPPEWIGTLDRLAKLDFDKVIGGHGEVQSKGRIQFFQDCIRDLIEETRKAFQRGETAEEAKKSVGSVLAPRYEAGTGGTFWTYFGGDIERIYKDLAAHTY